MATATKRTRKVEKVTTETVNDGATLVLSKDEAETLSVVLANVGGSAVSTRRKHTEGILTALDRAGIYRPYSKNVGLTGVMTFNDNQDPFSINKPIPFDSFLDSYRLR